MRSIGGQLINASVFSWGRWTDGWKKEGRKKHALRDRRRDPSPILGTELFFFFLKLIGKVVIKKKRRDDKKRRRHCANQSALIG